MSQNNDQLSAWLDGELSAEEVAHLEQRLQEDASLRARLRQLQDTRHLYRRAFSGQADLQVGAHAPRQRHTSLAIAASVLLALGGLMGWQVHHAFTPRSGSFAPHGVISLDAALPSSANESARVILHVDSNKARDLEIAVSKAERLLADYSAANKPLKLEFIANAGGLALLRSDVTPLKNKLQDLQARYPNLTLLACGKTIARLKNEKGINAKLVPGVIVVPSALDQIIHRLREDWAYIRT